MVKGVLERKLSKDIIGCLHNIFGDSDKQISKKTGLSKKLISSVGRGEKGLTYKNMKKIEKGYRVPHSIILLKSIEQKEIPKGMGEPYESLKRIFIASAELSEAEGNIRYGNWRDLI